jgi:hypothetical protein
MLEEYATLTAAICVVHDRPLSRRINENGAKSPEALAVFDYFVKNEKQMFFGIKPVPAEMLIYVVDTTASIEEMDWALVNYQRDAKVGSRFFDIRYDFDHLRNGTPKRVTSEGFTLQNILKYGGVCADQAYFATSVGKAIGVPTAYTTGAAGETAHAWVGFLQAKDRQGWWNFDVGRYEAYRGVRGMVLDPQMREGIPDSYVSLLAELIPTRPADRQAAVALSDAAWRLIEAERDGKKFAPPAPGVGVSGFNTARVRKATVEFELELLEQAVRLSPGDRGCWLPVRELAKAGRLKLEMKKHWADVLEKLCGQRYPDFVLAILGPMIQTVEDVAEQNRLWDRTFDLFRDRADLAASIRMAQAAMWEKQKQVDKAGFCYMDVIERYANAGPFVLEALQRAEKALRDSKRAERVPMLYEQAWERIHRPKEMASPYMRQSNWYRVGQLYAAKLSEAGKVREANAVRQELGVQAAEASPERQR